MCGLLIDAGVIMLLVNVLNDDDNTELFKAGVVGFAMSFAVFLLTQFLAGFGLIALLLGLVPSAAICGGILWVACDVAPIKALLGGVIFLVYKIAFSVAYFILFSPAS